MLYKNCRELPYHNFNEIQVEGDLSYLIKDNEKHEDDDLKDHWINILEEYFSISNDFSQKKFFRDKAELNFLQLKLSCLKHLKPLLELDLTAEQKKQIEAILKSYRVKDIEQDILGTTDDINLKISRFARSYDEEEEKSNFEDALAVLRLNGCNIDRHKITVTEWLALLKQTKKKPSSENGKKK